MRRAWASMGEHGRECCASRRVRIPVSRRDRPDDHVDANDHVAADLDWIREHVRDVGATQYVDVRTTTSHADPGGDDAMTGFRSSTSQTVPRTRADAGSPNGNRPSGVGLPTRQRPRAVLALGWPLVTGLPALGYWAGAGAGSRVGVVASVRETPVGPSIPRHDLTTTEVAGDVTAVSASHLSELV